MQAYGKSRYASVELPDGAHLRDAGFPPIHAMGI